MTDGLGRTTYAYIPVTTCHFVLFAYCYSLVATYHSLLSLLFTTYWPIDIMRHLLATAHYAPRPPLPLATTCTTTLTAAVATPHPPQMPISESRRGPFIKNPHYSLTYASLVPMHYANSLGPVKLPVQVGFVGMPSKP